MKIKYIETNRNIIIYIFYQNESLKYFVIFGSTSIIAEIEKNPLVS